jgi:hypothetical protein
MKGDIDALRREFPGEVDGGLVDLAALGAMKDAGKGSEQMQKYFEAQCDLFGLDPTTFAPRENQLPGTPQSAALG